MVAIAVGISIMTGLQAAGASRVVNMTSACCVTLRLNAKDSCDMTQSYKLLAQLWPCMSNRRTARRTQSFRQRAQSGHSHGCICFFLLHFDMQPALSQRMHIHLVMCTSQGRTSTSDKYTANSSLSVSRI